jgi:DNA-binding response OmpR family regulator
MKKILIIEDDINIAKLIKRAVELKKYTAHIEYTGDKGLELINSNEFDLILLDIMLPKIDGFKIISKRKARIIN